MAKAVWLLLAFLLAGCGRTSWLEPPSVGTPTVWFPRLSTEDLNGDQQRIPLGLPGELKLFMVAYAEDQQAALKPWQAAASQLEREHPTFRAYGLPTLASSWTFARPMIDSTMRRDVRSRPARARVLPLYIDKARFNATLGLASEREVHAVLVDARGAVVWRRSGTASADAVTDLRHQVARRLRPST